jgi:hypothetical protein
VVAFGGRGAQSLLRGPHEFAGALPVSVPNGLVLWQRALSRRSQNGRVRWDHMMRIANRWLPVPRIHHPDPLRRLGVIT